MMIAYGKTKGRAHDLRFVEEGYQPAANEVVIEGDVLPLIETLNDPVDPRATRIADIDAQMNAAEQTKLLGRTAREDMLARLVRDYVGVAHPDVNPFTVANLTDPLALEAFAAFADVKSLYYAPGVGRLKAFDDAFVALRAERTQLQKQLAA